MNQDIVSIVTDAVESVELFIRNQPELVIESLTILLVLSVTALLCVLKNSRRWREQALELQSRVTDLEGQLAEGTAQFSVRARAEVVEEQRERVPELGEVGVTDVSTAEPLEERPEQAPSAVPATELVAEVPPAAEETAISRGLKKSRAGFLTRLTSFFSGRSAIDTSTLDDLEEILILSDVGARCASDLVDEVRKAATAMPQGLAPEELTGLLKSGIRRKLVHTPAEHQIYRPSKSPLVVLVVGVNGVGKTTTVAKLATKYIQQGKKVLAVAADTFRAAAVDQLAEWSSRVGFTLVRGSENAKPSAVVFDGMVAAKEGGFDVVIIDTAGRLHTKSNLMQELEGVRNSIRRHVPDGPHETVLVLDGVSGQNALVQAREFNQAVPLSGIVVTKLDGTPKGGIIVAISQELALPVFFIGVGEKVDDLLAFDADAYVAALFEEDVRTSSVRSQEYMSHVSNQ
jgi:fused signal recognition particle receptor